MNGFPFILALAPLKAFENGSRGCSLSNTWSSRKRERQNTLRAVFPNAARSWILALYRSTELLARDSFEPLNVCFYRSTGAGTTSCWNITSPTTSCPEAWKKCCEQSCGQLTRRDPDWTRAELRKCSFRRCSSYRNMELTSTPHPAWVIKSWV